MAPLSPRAAREWHQAAPSRMREYQRNAGFVAFIMFICSAALVYLTGKLRGVLLPLIWAAFFAMPLTGFISTMDLAISRCLRAVRKWCKRSICRSSRGASQLSGDGDTVPFRFSADETYLRIPLEMSSQLVKRVNEPASAFCGKFGAHCCRRRIRITELTTDPPMPEGHPAREVNRFVQGWRYYIENLDKNGHVMSSVHEADYDEQWRHQVHLYLFLDPKKLYPAVIEPRTDRVKGEGFLVIDTTHTVSNAFATMLALGVVVLSCVLFATMLSFGVDAVNANVEGYILGGRQLIESVSDKAKDMLPNSTIKQLDDKANSFLGESLPGLAGTLVEVAEGGAFQTLLFLLYLLFWTFEPLPINGKVSGLINTFLLQKSLVCLIFASLMGLLLYSLSCQLWPILFVVAFLLNYIPEVGPIVCFIVMLPLVLLDGNLPIKQRYENAVWFSVLFLIAKFITGNIIEVKLYAKSGGDLMRMHPVVLMASMMLFDALMGPTGMFMTVPLMASLKYYMLSADMPPMVLDPLLTCIEGSEHGPHMNYVEMHRATKHAELVHERRMEFHDDKDSSESGGEEDYHEWGASDNEQEMMNGPFAVSGRRGR